MIETYRDPRPSLLDRVFGVAYGPWGVALLVLLLTGLRLGMLSPGDAPPVMPEEARPWLLGLSPRPGYADAAPLGPWILGWLSETCGSTTPCLRLVAPIAHGLVTWMMYLLGRRLFDARTGFWTALTYATLPMVVEGSVIVDPMALVLLAWAVGLHALARLTVPGPARPSRPGSWVVLGASVGVGLLAHPVMALFALATLAYLAVSPEFRGGRLWGGLGLAGLAAAAIYGPEVAWHAAHDWDGYRRLWSALAGGTPDPRALGWAVVVGILMFGPVLAAALIRAMARVPFAMRTGALADYRVRLLVIFTMPVLLVTLALTLVLEAGATLTAPAAIAACLLVVGWKVVHEAVTWLRVAIAVNLLLFVLLTSGVPFARDCGWVPPAWFDPVAGGRGWDETGAWIRGIADAYPETPIGVAGDGAPVIIYHARALGVQAREVGAGPDAGRAFAGLLVMPEALAEDGGDIRARLSVRLDDGRRRAWAAVMVRP
ncbi:glycosyltransferase family 39 protein [Roseospira visakhapatnamensis]|uniref:Glycosyltransferase RgtA/B/C/D-like domain-containing protein n=1 Tax=Roseospira visakhapatnamensis TaxID=390880 RepID=A0A7W6RAM5_9PROT|nr:glycosyltransferase family 39 protein [Roseospira visakhapatnamensis]MBB4265013.1 hypothetical protein [Roseospira visakhapatnamensis]